ncbi:hypothetical protein OHA37_27085 [Streptomyces sp. NBC_00335]|uniref:hypothetical protein n=1 Tax=unclassified Streptomyces TaxID=2593676 RepID=UPI0022583999|nr:MULTISPECIES: hypothetical protein [unclassified Streptomyces]MCX5407516.1 hypothetical protein [Streptomyces sp. NBC_00086]
MTVRRLRVLIQGLPPESGTLTALRNAMPEEELDEQAEKGEPEKGRWSQSELLLASAIDALRRVEYVLICANTESKRARPSPPEPIPRPGAKTRKPKVTLTETSANKLFELINGGAA